MAGDDEGKKDLMNMELIGLKSVTFLGGILQFGKDGVVRSDRPEIRNYP